jgi:hypothetical protein
VADHRFMFTKPRMKWSWYLRVLVGDEHGMAAFCGFRD